MNKIILVLIFLLFGRYNIDAEPIRLATTTSTENSGLLKVIIPHYESDTGYKVYVISVGTGQALRMGQDGNVDVVLVHAPKAEKRFVKAGYGINRRSLMFNDFVIVGPYDDPAKIRGHNDLLRSLEGIANGKHLFVSRGDDSGTHKKELNIWQKARLKPEISWYREVGQGMARVLQMANELNAYTITDRGTWLVMRPKLSLDLLFEGDPELYNPYSIIAVNPARFPSVNYLGAMSLIAWLTSVKGQKHIKNFRLKGERLFFPTAINK